MIQYWELEYTMSLFQKLFRLTYQGNIFKQQRLSNFNSGNDEIGTSKLRE